MVGQTISHYRVLEKLGEGGMGVVYKAEDTKLERTVALKFLAAHLLNDSEAKERFLREAKAAAALDHPNICTVHEIDEAEGKTFLAMAFLKGETLEDRIAQGPLVLKDALDIGRQVAEGLSAAHAERIVHRDIKPANILVSPEGRATIMDFGLARLTEASRVTRADQTVGTAAYMSPEQMQGGEVDHRSDIWALGCVLYEMVAGVRSFKGEYAQALAYEIVGEEPEPLTGVRAGVPIELEFIVAKCLAKDSSDRYQHASEIAVDLRNLSERLKSGRSAVLRTGLTNTATPIPTEVPGGRWQNAALVGLSILSLALAAALWMAGNDETGEVERPVRRFSFLQPGLATARISPDGRHIIFTARPDGRSKFSLWLRSLALESVRELPGTAGAHPSVGDWSPDGQSVLFAHDGHLKRIAIHGGDPVSLCALPDWDATPAFGSASWSPDGQTIVFAHGSAVNFHLYQVPSIGGEPQILLEPDEGTTFHTPQFLPLSGSLRLLYTRRSASSAVIEVLDLESGQTAEVAEGSGAVYSPQGFLLHGNSASAGGVAATPFSLDTLQATGPAFPVDARIRWPTVSRDGTLVGADISGPLRRILVRDRDGIVLHSSSDLFESAIFPAVSPDGSRVALAADRDMWIYDVERDVATRLTFTEEPEHGLAWSAESELSYFSPGARGNALFVRNANGGGEASLLFSQVGASKPDWSRDGSYFAYQAGDPTGGEGGIWYRERLDDRTLSEPTSFLRTPVAENGPQISPDARLVAYESNVSGQFEVYVRSFPDGRTVWQVSTRGGGQPRWSANGTELFYVEGATLMTTPISTRSGFERGRPRPLFESQDLRLSRTAWFHDVFPDGQRFVTLATEAEEAVPRVRIVENWYEEFRERE